MTSAWAQALWLRASLQRARQKALVWLVWPFLLVKLLRAKAPAQMLIAPSDIRTTDPSLGQQIYAGWFSFAGHNPNAHGRSPFEITPPSAAWQAELEGFGWLRHVRAADTALTRLNARTLVSDWLELRGSVSAIMGLGGAHPAWSPAVAARRLISFLAQSPLLLEGVDADFYHAVMVTLARHGVFLRHALRVEVQGEARLVVCIALAMLALSCSDAEATEAKATQKLTQELARQVLPDGGHVSRNPQVLVDLLLDLLPLRRAYTTRGLAPPAVLLNTIDRMMPMLRLFRHTDGALALFNGMGSTQPDMVATVLAYDDAQAAPLENAPASGYQRMASGPSVVIVDTGCAPPAPFSIHAHASALAFELSSGGQHVVVNCGAPDARSGALWQAARTTAAHSTLVLADASSVVFGPQATGSVLVSGPSHIPLTRESTPVGMRLAASHDGYATRFGFVHGRRLQLSADGLCLEGEDALAPAGEGPPVAHPFAVRFHMAHDTALTLAAHGSAVLITLADGQAWVMEAPGMALQVDESVSAAAAQGPRPSQQIVLAGHTDTSPRVTWRLQRRADLDLQIEGDAVSA